MPTIDQMAAEFKAMTPEQRHAAEQAIGRDLEKCDIGIALSTGKLRRTYTKQRKLLSDAVAAMGRADGVSASVDDLADEIASWGKEFT